MEKSWEQSLDTDDADLPSLLRPCKRRRSTPEIPRRSPPPSPASTIPGPAGAVQAAMRRKDLDCASNFSNGGVDSDGGVMSTQEYIRTAMSDDSEFDEDFTRSPWLSALKLIRSEDRATKRTPISSVKKCVGTGKLDLLVAVIKSSTPNGLGGLMVTLKDPSGTVGGSVHHRVLTESEFGRNLTVGAVIVLAKVAIFAPVRTAQYVNITLNNVVKVFSPDGGSTEQSNAASHPVRNADPNPAHNNVTADEFAKEKQPCIRALDQDSANGNSEAIAKGNNAATIGKRFDEENIEDRVHIHKQHPPILKSSLPNWTDEQLNELFAADDDDSLPLS